MTVYALKRNSYDDIMLKTSKTNLSTLQNEVQVTGDFRATARNQTRGSETTSDNIHSSERQD